MHKFGGCARNLPYLREVVKSIITIIGHHYHQQSVNKDQPQQVWLNRWQSQGAIPCLMAKRRSRASNKASCREVANLLKEVYPSCGEENIKVGVGETYDDFPTNTPTSCASWCCFPRVHRRFRSNLYVSPRLLTSRLAWQSHVLPWW